MKMPSLKNTVLPARAKLKPAAFKDAQVYVLDFPFADVLFPELKKLADRKMFIPWRQLNNALLTCCPTLTFGFEKHKKQRQALVMARSGEELHLPEVAIIEEILYMWLNLWAKEFQDKPDLQRDLDVLMSECQIPSGWGWKKVDAEELAFDPSAKQELGYRAIPALLTSMLHDHQMILDGVPHMVTWRKVLDSEHTHLVSQPFYAEFEEDNKPKQAGFFAYRLDFAVQTQAGRVHPERPDILDPWIFLSLSVQRYAREQLTKSNFRRRISVLLGLKEGLLPNSPKSTALVRLQMERKDTWQWLEQLPNLLAELKARPLIEPAELVLAPEEYGMPQVPVGLTDTYQLVHVEGYKYGQLRGKGHPIKTGYSFKEKVLVFSQVFSALQQVLIPDGPLKADLRVPLTLGVSQNHATLAKSHKKQSAESTDHGNPVLSAIQRATQKDGLSIFLFYASPLTLERMCFHLRKILGLPEDGDWSQGIHVQAVEIPDDTFLKKHRLPDKKSKNAAEHWRAHHCQKRDQWLSFLQQTLPVVPPGALAFVELGKALSPSERRMNPEQNIRGAVREAMALHGLSSQMVFQVTTSETKGTQPPEATKSSENRVRQAALDLVFRHNGVLLGSPAEAYVKVGLPAAVASKLDVIGIILRQDLQSAVKYAAAVRLCADGAMQLLTPDLADWVPYVVGGSELGSHFSRQRPHQFHNKWQHKPLNLSSDRLAQFLIRILTQQYCSPTLVCLNAVGWRNEGLSPIWPQMKNEHLHQTPQTLIFDHVSNGGRFQRTDPSLNNLVGVVRIRRDDETPQYVTGHRSWQDREDAPELGQLSGFVDTTTTGLFHYFSVGRVLLTQKEQRKPQFRNLLKMGDWDVTGKSISTLKGATIAFKHQQLVEMVPFFVREDLNHAKGYRALCRVLHQLRTSPNWHMGNIASPYPMHLAECVLDDQLCILGSDA